MRTSHYCSTLLSIFHVPYFGYTGVLMEASYQWSTIHKRHVTAMFGFFLRSLSWAQLAIIESSYLWNKFGKSLNTYTKLKIFPHCIRHPWSECPSPFTSGHFMNTLLICLFVCLFFLITAPYEAKLWCGEALGEWGPRGCFKWQYHGPGK